jgi:hypothetical protein
MIKTYFWQTLGSYPGQIFVAVGLNGKETIAAARDIEGEPGSVKIWNKFVSENEKELLENIEEREVAGCVITDDEEAIGILYLNSFDGGHKDRCTLIHELHHVVHFMLMEDRGFQKEPEALAYQQEFLYNVIAKHLDALVVPQGVIKGEKPDLTVIDEVA